MSQNDSSRFNVLGPEATERLAQIRASREHRVREINRTHAKNCVLIIVCAVVSLLLPVIAWFVQ